MAAIKTDQVQGTPDVVAIMKEIRERVRAAAAEAPSSAPRAKPFAVDPDARAARRAGEMVHSEELRYLNTHVACPVQVIASSITSHRPGFIGKLIVAIKRKLLSVFWFGLRGYFDQEREYRAQLVRFLNQLTTYVDARDASNFWELIRKLDYDISKALERIERIADEQNGSLRSIERSVVDQLNQSLGALQRSLTELRGTSEQHTEALRVVDSVARGLEAIVARGAHSSPSLPTAPERPAPDYSYVLLENRYRGSEEEVASRCAIYPPLFAATDGRPVLEIGAGRGELQRLFKQAGVASYGVDSDGAMVESARERGVDVRLGDGIQHLAACEPRSLSGVIAIQVVEHLPRDVLAQLIHLAVDRTKDGGVVVFETINPTSVLALSSNYFRDPTHVMPQHPDTLSYMLSLAGCEAVEVRHLSPVPEQAKLRALPIESFMTPRWARTVELFNHNVQVLNNLLFAEQDFAVIARVRKRS